LMTVWKSNVINSSEVEKTQFLSWDCSIHLIAAFQYAALPLHHQIVKPLKK